MRSLRRHLMLHPAMAISMAGLLAACSMNPFAPTPTPFPSNQGPSLTPSAVVAAWTEVAAAGTAPPGREDHTWTVGASGETAYVFGGRDDGGPKDDFWAFDLATNAWQAVERDGDSPDARSGHAAVWVPNVGLVVSGGQVSGSVFGDLWAFDPAAETWRELDQAGARPSARSGACAAVAGDGRLWLTHGVDAGEELPVDTWAYDPATGAWTDMTPGEAGPVGRQGAACWWTSDGRFVLYTGLTDNLATDDLWVLEGAGTEDAAWRQIVLQPAPAARSRPAYTRGESAAIVVGGFGNDGYAADAYRVADDTLIPGPIVGGDPRALTRVGATLIDDAARNRLLLFGGRSVDRSLADMWALATG